MNGLRTSLWRCRRLYEAEPENDHVSGPFFNFGRRHCLEIESLASLAARRESDGNIFSPKGRKPVRGAKESFPGAKRRPARRVESKTGRGESISSAGDSDENRRKSVCRSVCTFDFGGQEAPQRLRAVGLRPDSNDFRIRPYAPYAVPLKGKGRKRSNSQKRCIKCIRLFACPLSPTPA